MITFPVLMIGLLVGAGAVGCLAVHSLGSLPRAVALAAVALLLLTAGLWLHGPLV